MCDPFISGILVIIIVIIGAGLGYFLGYQLTAYPSEEVMLSVLIELQANRKIKARTKEELNDVIKNALAELKKE
jgi:hypothetical protein